MRHNTRTADTIVLVLVALVGISLRIYLIALYHGYGDLVRFGQSAEIFAHGGNIYVEQYYWNYTPVYGYIIDGLYHLPLRFDVVLRLFLMIVSFTNAILVAKLSKRPGHVFTLYWLNPALILYEAYGGQFEQVALLPILLAVYNNRTWLLGTLALLIKHITLPIVWALYVYRNERTSKAALWMIAALALFALSFAPYLPDGAPRIVERVLLYKSFGGYGIGSAPVFLVAIIIAPFIAKRLNLDLIDGLLFAVLMQMVFMPGMSSNYYVLLLAFGMVRPSWWILPITALCVLFVSPWFGIEGTIAGFNTDNALWFISLAWLVAIAVKRVRQMHVTDASNGVVARALYDAVWRTF